MSQNHLVDHIENKELISNNKLHVIGVISNFARFHSRYRLFREWADAMRATPNVELYIVEVAFGHRHFEVTEAHNPHHLQLRTQQEIWHKENMINLGVRRLLPKEWRYMAWVDADVFYPDINWAQETLHQLQHYKVMQPWKDALDLGFFGTVSQHFKSFCFQHRRGIPKQCHPSQPYVYAHSGFAWACRRDFFENITGLMDFGLLGSADHHMAWALINQVDNSIHKGMSHGFFEKCHEWQQRAYGSCHGFLGFTPTRIEHKFHGPKNRRRYRERWEILIKHRFDPIKDLTYDDQGLLTLIGKPSLLNDCREYFMQRHEDSIEET